MAGLRAVSVFVVGLLLLIPISPRSLALGTATRVEVPISQRRLSDGNIRYSVPVRVGGSGPIDAMLDTGSFGLRVLAGALVAAQYEATGVMRNYRFGSGVRFRGELAKAVVSIGDTTTGVPVVIQIIQSIGCAAARPDCPAARVGPFEYGIGGDGLPREGFQAILGLSMRSPAMPLAALNPLASVGDEKWIVELPLPGDPNPGKLIVNPSAADLAHFRLVQLTWRVTAGSGGGSALIDTEIPGCLDADAAPAGSCAPMRLDTGARNGLQPFYSFVVLYDQKRGVIGVKPRRHCGIRGC